MQKVLATASLLREQVGPGLDIIAIAPRGVGSTLPAMTRDSTDLIASRRRNCLSRKSDSLYLEWVTGLVERASGRHVSPDLVGLWRFLVFHTCP